MTQNKRFRISQGYTNVFCHDWENNKLLGFEQTVDCLNTFYEENEQLKKCLMEIEKIMINGEDNHDSDSKVLSELKLFVFLNEELME